MNFVFFNCPAYSTCHRERRSLTIERLRVLFDALKIVR